MRTPATVVVLSAAALALAAFALALVLQRPSVAPPSGVAAAVAPAAAHDPAGVALDALATRLDELERRVAAAGGGAAAERSLAQADEPTAALQRFEQRLTALEAEFAQLRAEIGRLGPMPDTPAGVLAALEDKNLFGPDATAAQRQRRRELWMRFLELAPRDPQAAAILERLFEDQLAEDPGAALAILDRHQPLVALPSLKLDRLRANGLSLKGDADGARAIYARIAADRNLPEEQRLDAAFWHAYSWKQQGRYDEARREFEALIASCPAEASPALVSLVAGARAQLAQIDEWQQQQQR